jgi:hypothetical protein
VYLLDRINDLSSKYNGTVLHSKQLSILCLLSGILQEYNVLETGPITVLDMIQ